MKAVFTSLRPRLALVALIGLALTATACAEDDDPTTFSQTGEVSGTWVAQDSAGTTYLRVASTTVQVYSLQDTCFTVRSYDITGIDGGTFTLMDEDSAQAQWSVQRSGPGLVVASDSLDLRLDPTDVSLSSLPVCDAGAAGDFPHAPCSEIPQVAIGGSEHSSLESGDPRWSDNTWYELWSVRLNTPSTVTISLTADDVVDTYLLVYDASATTRVAENDDVDYDGGNYNSRATVELQPGCYIIVAGSYSETADDAGGYTVAVDGPPPPDFPHEPCGDLPALQLGQSVLGRLDETDATWEDGTYYDLWSLQIASTTNVTITERAGAEGDLDTFLMLYNAAGTERIDDNDDIGGGDYDSRISTELDPGCYIVVANSYSDEPGEAGTYQLTASPVPPPPAFPAPDCVDAPYLAVGDSIVGMLEPGDSTWSDGTWYDLYSIQLASETDITLSERAGSVGSLDTYLAIYNFDATVRLERNDDVDYDNGNYNSEIQTTLGPGCFLVVANSYSDEAGEEGEYVLKLTSP